MNEALTGKLDLFQENLTLFNKEFKNEDSQLRKTGALYYTFNEAKMNPEDIKKSLEIIRGKYKFTSPFRGSIKNILTFKFIDREFNDEYLKRIEEIYTKITVKWKSSEYKALITLLMIEEKVDNIDQIIERTDALYNDMKANHKGVTSDNDYLMAFLLALLNGDVNSITEEVEKAYAQIKPNIKNSDVVQYLSHITTILPGDYQEKAEKVVQIAKIFEEKKMKLGEVGLSSIGLFASSEQSAEEIAGLLLEIEGQLKTIKGFRFVGRNIRISYSSYLLYYILKDKMEDKEQKDLFILRLLAITVMVSTINSLKFIAATQ